MGQDHSHTINLSQDERYKELRKVTLIGSVVDLVLGIAKILVGLAVNSAALLADGIHSLSDLATNFLVLFAAKHSHRDADEEHPYGHGRIETVATVGLGVALFMVTAGIFYDAIQRVLEPAQLQMLGVWALLVAGLSIASKEAIYHYTMRVAIRHRSNMLRANAWHSRSDAISSVIVMVGVGGSMAGVPSLDAIAAIGVALMIGKIAWDLSWQGLRELIDTALDPEETKAIKDVINSVEGVRALHMLRTRRSGAAVLVDVHILVEPTLSVSEGHQISGQVSSRLITELVDVSDVTVHIDPEDDELSSPCDHLPARDEMLARLQQQWSQLLATKMSENVTLHYLDGRVHVELVLPLSLAESPAQAQQLSEQLQVASQQLPEIGEVKVYYH